MVVVVVVVVVVALVPDYQCSWKAVFDGGRDFNARSVGAGWMGE